MCLPNSNSASAAEGVAKRMRTSYDLQPLAVPHALLPDARFEASSVNLDAASERERQLLFWRAGAGGRGDSISTSLANLFERDRTSNSASSIIADNQMCVGPSSRGGEVTEISFPGVTPRPRSGADDFQSWHVQSVESCTRGYQSNDPRADMKLDRNEEDEAEHMSMDNSATNAEGTDYPVGKLEMDLSSGQSKLCPRGHWRPAEDEKLKELVSLYGPQNWNLIAEKIHGRSGKSCRLRWFNQLDPRINRQAFTEDEEERLIAAHRFHGNKWAMIARLFPGRTDNGVKNHYHVVESRKKKRMPHPNPSQGRQARKVPPQLSRRGRKSPGDTTNGMNVSQHTAGDSIEAWLEKYKSPTSDVDSASLSSQFDGVSNDRSLKASMMLSLPKGSINQPMPPHDIDNGLSPSVNSGLLSRAAESLAEKGSFVGLTTSQQGGLYAGPVTPNNWFLPSLLPFSTSQRQGQGKGQARASVKEESERSSTRSSPLGSTSASELHHPHSPYLNENNGSSSNSSRLSSQLWGPESRPEGLTKNRFRMPGKVQGSDNSSHSTVLHKELDPLALDLSWQVNQPRERLSKETASTASWVTNNDSRHHFQEAEPEVEPEVCFYDFLGVGER